MVFMGILTLPKCCPKGDAWRPHVRRGVAMMSCCYKGEPIIKKRPAATAPEKPRGRKPSEWIKAFGPMCGAERLWWKDQGFEKWLPSCTPEEMIELMWHFSKKTLAEREHASAWVGV